MINSLCKKTSLFTSIETTMTQNSAMLSSGTQYALVSSSMRHSNTEQVWYLHRTEQSSTDNISRVQNKGENIVEVRH